MDGNVDVARAARSVDFLAQFHAGGLIEKSVRRTLENRCHVGRNRVRPGIAVVTGIVTREVTKERYKGGIGSDRKKILGEDRVRHCDRIIGLTFRMDVVQSKIDV